MERRKGIRGSVMKREGVCWQASEQANERQSINTCIVSLHSTRKHAAKGMIQSEGNASLVSKGMMSESVKSTQLLIHYHTLHSAPKQKSPSTSEKIQWPAIYRSENTSRGRMSEQMALAKVFTSLFSAFQCRTKKPTTREKIHRDRHASQVKIRTQKRWVNKWRWQANFISLFSAFVCRTMKIY